MIARYSGDPKPYVDCGSIVTHQNGTLDQIAGSATTGSCRFTGPGSATEATRNSVRLDGSAAANREPSYGDVSRTLPGCRSVGEICVRETVRAGVLQEVVLSVVLKDRSDPTSLLEAIRQCNDNHKVTLVMGQQAVDL